MIRSRIDDAGECGLRNFAQTSYVGSNCETCPMFTMTREGYQFLVGKTSGVKAFRCHFAKRMGDMRAAMESLGLGGQFPDSLTVAEYPPALSNGSSRHAPPSG